MYDLQQIMTHVYWNHDIGIKSETNVPSINTEHKNVTDVRNLTIKT
jgi:hypothetical protein